MQALAQRQLSREFDPAPLSDQALSDLPWAAAGIKLRWMSAGSMAGWPHP